MSRGLVSRYSKSSLDDLFQHVPDAVKLDIVQMALDLAGIVNPAADAASGFISLLRGDLLGAAVSALSILPIGDVAKLAKFGAYRKSLTRLVDLAFENKKTARVLEPTMREIRHLLESIQGFVGTGDQTKWFRELDLMKGELDRYFARLARLKQLAGKSVGLVARKNGRATGQFIPPGGKPISVERVVTLLEEGAQANRHAAIKGDASEFLDILATSKGWKITAAPHPSASDATNHITVLVQGMEGQFHLRMDRSGHLFQITDMTGKPLSGIQPWISPGTAM